MLQKLASGVGTAKTAEPSTQSWWVQGKPPGNVSQLQLQGCCVPGGLRTTGMRQAKIMADSRAQPRGQLL